MDNELLNLISEFSLETIIIASIIFVLTMIVKLPIKIITNKTNEAKRKAINSVFILIPLIFSFLITTLYYGINESVWFSINHIRVILTSWLLSLSIYNIFERGKFIVINFFNNYDEKELVEETESEIKKLINKLNEDKQKLKQIDKHISELTNNKSSNLSTIFKSNIEIANLNDEKEQLKTEIDIIKNEIEIKNT